MFEFPLTDIPQGQASNVSACSFLAPSCDCKIGTYADGLLTVLSKEEGLQIMEPWDWLESGTVALISTAFGGVFVSLPSQGIFFLDPQRNHIEFVDKELDWVITEFIKKPSILEHVFRQPQFGKVVASLQPLKYGEVYILEPWAMLGGVEDSENYSIGKLDVYLEVVAQAHSG